LPLLKSKLLRQSNSIRKKYHWVRVMILMSMQVTCSIFY